MSHSDDNEVVTLSDQTLAALQAFQEEQHAEQERFAALQARAQARFGGDDGAVSGNGIDGPDIDLFHEDWQLSQFWYTSETAEALATEVLSVDSNELGDPPRVGVLCAPSVYPKLLAQQAADAWLFEYDTRFEVLAGPKFVKYDYNYPFQLPQELRGTFDALIIDPPFLSDECEVKAATTARWLGKSDARFIVCSGAKMRDLLLRLYKARETKFNVEHRNGRLSNDFLCLMNYTSTNSETFGFLEGNGITQEYVATSIAA